MTNDPNNGSGDDDDDFPRNRFRVSPQQILPIFALLITLFAVIALRKGCADGVATMFKSLSPPPDAANPADRSPYIRLPRP